MSHSEARNNMKKTLPTDPMKLQLLITIGGNDNLVKQNRILERKCTANEQYSRRECLEISGNMD